MATANEIEIRVTVDDATKAPFQKIENKLKSLGRSFQGFGGGGSSGKGGLFGSLFSGLVSIAGVAAEAGGAMMKLLCFGGPSPSCA